MKTSELTGAALDWAVAKCEGVTVLPKMRGKCYVTLVRGETVLLNYSSDWAQGGPIIERERLTLTYVGFARDDLHAWQSGCGYYGPTPLIAAMRCYVAIKLGDEVDVPEELK